MSCSSSSVGFLPSRAAFASSDIAANLAAWLWAWVAFSNRPTLLGTAFLAYVLGPMEQGHAPIFIVLNAAPEEIAFKFPAIAGYKGWQQVLNTTEAVQAAADFAVGAETKAPPRSVLAFSGAA